MGLLDLLKTSQEAAPKSKKNNDEPHLHFIDMSRKGYNTDNGHVPANQGTIKFLPIVSLSGQELKYAYDVNCYNYEGEERNQWVRFMDVKDYEQELTDEQKAKVLAARSLVEHYSEKVDGFPYVDFKSYALMFGYILEHTSIDDNAVITNSQNRKTAILIFPSKNFSKAMTSCLTDMQGLGDEMAEVMYNDLFSRNPERKCFLTIQFQKGEGFGYDCTVTAKPIDVFCKNMLTPDELKAQTVVIPDSELEFATYLSAVMFGNNYETADDFNEEMCDKAIEQMKYWIDKYENDAKAASEMPAIPSKNKKKLSDLDE